MKPSKFYDLTIGAGESAMLQVEGDYFKMMSVSSAITVRSSFGELVGLIAGQGLEATPFRYLTFYNPGVSANTIRVYVGDENFIDGLSGSMSISEGAPSRDAFAHLNVTVTTAAADHLAANTSRSFLMVQNRSGAGTIYVRFDGASSIALGIKLGPGQAWESGQCCPTGAVSIIGDIASNPDVLIVHGS